MAGITEESAKASGVDYEMGRGRFETNSRAAIAGDSEGLIKLIFRRAGRRLLGVHILGEIASEIIHQGQTAVQLGATIDHFIHATFNVPTYSEAYKYAAYDGLQRLEARVPANSPRTLNTQLPCRGWPKVATPDHEK